MAMNLNIHSNHGATLITDLAPVNIKNKFEGFFGGRGGGSYVTEASGTVCGHGKKIVQRFNGDAPINTL